MDIIKPKPFSYKTLTLKCIFKKLTESDIFNISAAIPAREGDARRGKGDPAAGAGAKKKIKSARV